MYSVWTRRAWMSQIVIVVSEAKMTHGSTGWKTHRRTLSRVGMKSPASGVEGEGEGPRDIRCRKMREQTFIHFGTGDLPRVSWSDAVKFKPTERA